MSGKLTKKEMIEEFASQWDKVKDGVVTIEDFAEFYADINAIVVSDEHFENIIRKTWNIPEHKPIKT